MWICAHRNLFTCLNTTSDWEVPPVSPEVTNILLSPAWDTRNPSPSCECSTDTKLTMLPVCAAGAGGLPPPQVRIRWNWYTLIVIVKIQAVGLIMFCFCCCCSDVEKRANGGHFARHDKQKHLWLLSEDLPHAHQDQVSCYKNFSVLVVLVFISFCIMTTCIMTAVFLLCSLKSKYWVNEQR